MHSFGRCLEPCLGMRTSRVAHESEVLNSNLKCDAFPQCNIGLTRRQSQRSRPSRLLLAQEPRRPRSWLIFDVGQNTNHLKPNYVHNDTLNAAFSDEKVIAADLKTLKRYLLACTEQRETDTLNPRVKEGLPKRTEFIREMISLEIKAREMRLTSISVISAALFAAGAFFLTLRQEIRESRKAAVEESKAISATPAQKK